MPSINPKKLRVVELRKELESRGIEVPKNAKKPHLVTLLISALEGETEQEKLFSSSDCLDDSAVSESDEKLLEPDDEAKVDPSEILGEQAESMEEAAVPEPAAMATEFVDAEVTPEAASEASPEPKGEHEEHPEQLEMKPEAAKFSLIQANAEIAEATVAELTQDEQAESEVAADDGVSNEALANEVVKDEIVGQASEAVDANCQASAEQEAENGVKQDFAAGEGEAVSGQKQDGIEVPESMESEPVGENGSVAAEHQEDKDSGSKQVQMVKQEQSRKRPRDDQSNLQSKWEDRFQPPEEEPADDFDDSVVALDVYNCDLNFKVSRDRMGGLPLTMEGFAYLWAGARATYGVKNGKAFFECKVAEEVTVKHLPSDEPHPHVVRVGWSTNSSSLQLGEEGLSYGYGGTGKFSVSCNFSDYGETFRRGDVIGCYVDLTADENVKMYFTKNGKFLDVAFTEEKSKLSDEALFPHVLCKNTSVEVNFGQKDEPFFPNPDELEGYAFVSVVPKEELVRATKSPEARKECEVLMMCGLPGAGKTHYSRQLMKDHPERKYNVLGTNAIMEKMRVMGVARKKNYAHRWEILIHNANQCLNRLLQIACRKRRNYILDQTNVYPTAQMRKMRPFEGFQRKAIVVVPTEEEYKKRFDSRTKEEGKAVPESAILEMKANFSLPEVGKLFEEVVFTDLAQEEADKLVKKYREEGRKHGPPPEKRSRMGDNRGRGRDGGGWRPPRGFRGSPMYGNQAPWGGFRGGPMGFGRGSFSQPGFRGRGGPSGGFGNRQGGFGRGSGRGGGDGRDSFNRRNDRGNNRGKRGWQDFGSRGGSGGRGGAGGYGGQSNRQNQSRGFNHSRGGGGGFQNASSGSNQFQGRGGTQNKKFQQGNRMMQSTQSSAPHSAQSYTYGHHPSAATPQTHLQYNVPKVPSYSTGSYTYGQQNVQQQNTTPVAAAVPSVQAHQAYGQQQNYSQQWAQYYQQQAQTQQQQYQNYYANYQQYYGQQAAQQTPRQ